MKSYAEQVIAEFMGTFALVFVGVGSALVAGGVAGPFGVAVAHGLILAVMVSNLGHISGAHFNPAVTLGVWVAGKIESLRALAYIFIQLLGAVAAAALLRLALPETIWEANTAAPLGVTSIIQDQGITATKAVILEATLTFFLAFTVFATAVDDRGVFRSVAGLPIGFVLMAAILVAGPLTGASLNPARSFGPALMTGTWDDFWVYLAGPIAGAILASSLYWFVYLRDRQVRVSRTETPIGGGPEEDLGVPGVADVVGDDAPVDPEGLEE